MTRDSSRRDRYWPEVERFFGGLPPYLFRQGLQLKNTLTVRYADSGRLEDVLCREHDYPLLSFGFWLLDDLGVPEGEARAALEQHVFLAAFFSFAAMCLHEGILDQDSFFEPRFIYLEQALVQRATFHYAQLFPGGDPFWETHQALWDAYAEANLWEVQLHTRTLVPGETDDLRRCAGKLAPAKLPVAAVALHCRRRDLLPRLFEMMDRLNLVFQARREILSMRRDLFQGRYTYPIVRTMLAAGIPLRAPLVPEQVLGAMLLTGAVREICQESLEDLERCREVTRELDLPTWRAFFDRLEAITRELLALFTLGAASRPDGGRRQATFTPVQESLATAIRMAERYLLSDLTFRESWEVQRWGMLGIPEVTCQAFPAGTIVELLCANGHDLAPQVDEVFRILERNRFRYYDRFYILPDADDLGLLLRLYRYSDRRQAHREMLERPLRWMEANVLPSGEIPVYFTEGVDVAIDPANIWATHCISVEINLLLGLVDYDWERYRGLIAVSAMNLFDRTLKQGWGLTTNYDLLYALWALARLVAQLSPRPIDPALHAKMAQVSALWRERLAQEAKRPFLSPQDAAFLTMACLDGPAEALHRSNWTSTMLKNQRYDGSWQAEPFYPAPNRGGVPTWYSSRSVTTAFCCHALQRVRAHESKESER